jgi:hypothetical protein
MAMNLRRWTAMAAVAALVAVGCGISDDGDDSAGGSSGSGGGNGSGNGNGGGLGGLFGKFNGNGNGNGNGTNTGGGSGATTGAGGSNVNGGGGSINGGGGTGSGLDCLTACGLVLNCVNQACGTQFTSAECDAQCEGSTESIPLSENSSCDEIATALEIGTFQAVCSEVTGGDDNGFGGETGFGGESGFGGDFTGGGTVDIEVCCDLISCAQGCGADQNCVTACVQDICAGDYAGCGTSCSMPDVVQQCLGG